MKPIGTPVYRPTADSIWNSFLISGKRHLILTGGRGAGKTTMVEQLCAGMPGIVTYAVPGVGVYAEEHPAGKGAQIGVFDPGLPGNENRMRACADGFEECAVPMVLKLAEGAGEWVFVDEIGYLESESPAYRNALRRLFEGKRVIAAVRRQDTPFLREIRERKDAFCVDLDAPFGNTGCVIMASGHSKRFGGNKLTADFRGKPMIMRILSATDGIFARRVVVTRHPEIVRLCRELGTEVILHDLPHRSDTVRLGLEAIGEADGCMFCPADQPLLGKDTVAALVLSSVHEPKYIWRPSFEGNHGSPVLFPRWAFDSLMRIPEGKGGGYIVRMHPGSVRTVPVKHGYELMDADDRETLEKLVNIDEEP